jgi:hypothetical protein
VLLRTLRNLNLNATDKAHGHLTTTTPQHVYELLQLLPLLLTRPLQLETDRYKEGEETFKDTATRCQLCKIHRRQICK